jgi:hypothetical protein
MEFIQTILIEGLNEIKENLNKTSKTLSPFEVDYIIEDELADLLDSPVAYIEDIVGYAEELMDEPIKDLSPLQRAIAKLHFEKGDTKKYLDRDLRNRVKDSKEFNRLFNLLRK